MCVATIAWMKNFGVAKSMSVSAPEPFSRAIWEATSEAVSSYDSFATTRGPLPATARVSPASMSRPSSVFSYRTATRARGFVRTSVFP